MSRDMQELFKEAAKIASVVPESRQEAAFNRALDMLTGGEQTPAKSTQPTPRHAGNKRVSSRNGGDAANPAVDRVAQVTAIPRDAAPEVDQEASVQGRSIALLVAAKREAEVDGLRAREIATILTEKFRHRTTRQAVQQAMDSAGNMIDHQRDGRAAVYRVMQTGEDWLGTPAAERTAARSRGSRRRAGVKSARAATAKKTSSTRKAPAGAKKTASSGGGRRTAGPKAVLESLIADGYFSEPRGMGDIKQHIRDQRAISFATSDVSPTLTRLLREGKLKRSKVENQYVYTAG